MISAEARALVGRAWRAVRRHPIRTLYLVAAFDLFCWIQRDQLRLHNVLISAACTGFVALVVVREGP